MFPRLSWRRLDLSYMPFSHLISAGQPTSLAAAQRHRLDQGVVAHLELDAVVGVVVAHGPDLADLAVDVEEGIVIGLDASLVLLAVDLRRRVRSFHVMSFHVISKHVISGHVISAHVM